jgi:hypothetical protein
MRFPLSLMLVVALFWSAACTSSGRKPRRTNLPHGNNVEYLHGAKILTQRFADRDELHYYLSELKLEPKLIINGKSETNHSFEIGSTASCKLSAPPPETLVFQLTHDIKQRSMWHFPAPKPSKGITEQNASFDIAFLADGQKLTIPGHYQIELRKDDPSDATFYETLITELSRQDFVKIANSRRVKVELGSFAAFDLDDETITALKAYAEIVSDIERWP